jgi:Protein of unknown function (DUF3455)
MKSTLSTCAAAAAAVAALLMSACAAQAPMMKDTAKPMAVDSAAMNAALPEAIRVPSGQKALMTQRGVGELTYECRAKKDMATQFEWAFVGPVATLMNADRKVVGKYYAGPTWESADGSKITGKQVAVSPAAAGNIPLQLVKADAAMGDGAMKGVSYIQRLKTQGGVAPSATCDAASVSKRTTVPYEADYVFYGM